MEKYTLNPVIRIEFGCSEKVRVVKYYSDFADPNRIENEVESYFETIQESNKYVQNPLDTGNIDNSITIYVELDDADDPLLKSSLLPGKKLVGPLSIPDKNKYVWVRVLDDNIIKLLSEIRVD